ncbi:GumC family protein [Bosea sp. NBC_00550]|uniref:GumC family protein n=1 Tax=Bosea sp. NBC_00550 TaxID=2969621 RepID=UPI0022322C98|nr:Wzz/FepE/Etk N-terminal domain-containing protein [Bosea sp. NBC_00550]UZF94392.1 Wzz/FepE/Etk N-terminal domain-containing protein [Bosea sp. NBC_00550]
MLIDLPHLFSILWKRKLASLLAMTAVVLAGVGFFVMAPPKFDGYTMVYAGDPVREGSWEASQMQEQRISSLVAIGETDDVLLKAAEIVGMDKILPKAKSSAIVQYLPLTIRSRLDSTASQEASSVAVSRLLRSAVRITPEQKTNLLRVVARHDDPILAARLADAVAAALIDRQIELRARPGAVTFFEQQRSRFDESVRNASAELAAYVTANQTYSVSEQRQHLLKRASELASALTATDGAVASAVGQREALTDQLKRLRPVTQSPFVSGLVDALGASSERSSTGRTSLPQGGFNGDPPLLLVRVYQDGLVALLKVNSEIAAATKLRETQQAAAVEINRELADLSKKEETFARLTKAVEIAASNAETYGRRIVEEQITADLAAAKMSNVRIAQAALVPQTAAFPSLRMLIPITLLCGLFAGAGIALLMEFRVGGFDRNAMSSGPRDTAGPVSVQDPFQQRDLRHEVRQVARVKAHGHSG